MNIFLHKRISLLFLFLTCSFTQIAFSADWYVNDASTIGDVFTTSIGNDANAGTPAAPFATIAFAISTATAGDTIYVDAGSYNGDVFVIKSLTLRGAKFGINAGPAAIPVGRGTNETIIAGGAGIYYGQTVDNITVDGFTIDLGIGIRGIEARGFNCVIINNIVTAIPNPLIQQAGISTRANGPLRLHSYLVRNNNVQGCRNGYLFDGNLENPSEFSFNYAAGCLNSGIQMVASDNHTIKANVSENNAVGLLVTEGNTIIEQNTFRNNSFAGVRLAGGSTLVGNRIQFNFFENNAAAIALTDPDPAAVGNRANFNSLVGNTINIGSLHAANFDATCNWYGTTDQAAIALTISGNVTFVPFLSDGVDSDPVLEGFQPITSCLVPVVLTAFTASVKNYDVLLNWQTEVEVNSSHFLIQKSIDNNVFTTVGRVEASGFSDNRKRYQFTDNKPTHFDRPVFYRLQMVDRDGTFSYSKIISVVLKTNGSFVQQVYPSPAKAGNLIYSNYIASSKETISLSLVNAMGQVLLQKQVNVIKGANQLSIPLPSGASGVHYLLFRATDQLHKVPVLIN